MNKIKLSELTLCLISAMLACGNANAGNDDGTFGSSSVAIGFNSVSGNQAAAFGHRANAADHASALGPFSSAAAYGSIAIGHNSVAKREAGEYGTASSALFFIKVDEESPVWKSTAGVFSIGNEAGDTLADGTVLKNAQTRQLTGVAAGSQDNDAVNVAQLRDLTGLTHIIFNETSLTH